MEKRTLFHFRAEEPTKVNTARLCRAFERAKRARRNTSGLCPEEPLYKRAFAFVFPTLFEGGFGFPILEAMDCGLPVITSGQGPYEPMEETVQDAGLLVGPFKHQ